MGSSNHNNIKLGPLLALKIGPVMYSKLKLAKNWSQLRKFQVILKSNSETKALERFEIATDFNIFAVKLMYWRVCCCQFVDRLHYGQ